MSDDYIERKSRFIPSQDMTRDQITDCGYHAMAILDLCERAGRSIGYEGADPALGGSVATALEVAHELVLVMQEALESHEGVRLGGRRMSMTMGGEG